LFLIWIIVMARRYGVESSLWFVELVEDGVRGNRVIGYSPHFGLGTAETGVAAD
jgi:hypothetical protein